MRADPYPYLFVNPGICSYEKYTLHLRDYKILPTSTRTLTDRDPMEDDASDVAPWETSREVVYGSGARRRQDSAADSGSSSSDVSAALAATERRRLPQQSTLDGGLRGAPPPLRRLSAVEPRHLAPLASPPHSPRAPPPAAPAPAAPPHPTPTISVSSAPDDDSPPSPRSLAPSDEPSSVFASPTDRKTLEDHVKTVSVCDNKTDIVEVRVCDATVANPRAETDSDRVETEDATALSREPSTITETSPASHKDTSSDIGELPTSSHETGGAGRAGSAEAPSPPDPPPPPPAEPAPVTTAQVASERLPSATDSAVTVTPKAEPVASTSEQKPTSHLKEPAPTTASNAAVVVPAVPQPETSSEAPKPVVAPVAIKEPVVTPSPVAKNTSELEATSSVTSRPPVAPLAVCEDLGADDDVEKVPSVTPVASNEPEATTEPEASRFAHKEEVTSVSQPSIVRDGKPADRKQRNDICPWEDE